MRVGQEEAILKTFLTRTCLSLVTKSVTANCAKIFAGLMAEQSRPPSSSKPPNPKLVELQQPEKLSRVLKEDQYDCLSCRLTGMVPLIDCIIKGVFTGISIRCNSLHRTWYLYLLFWQESIVTTKADLSKERQSSGRYEGKDGGYGASIFQLCWYGIV